MSKCEKELHVDETTKRERHDCPSLSCEGPFVVNVLHLPIQDPPLIFAPAGIGLVLGGLLMPSLTWRLGKSRTIALGSLSTAVGLLLILLGRFIWSRFALPVSELLLLGSAITFVIRHNA